MHESEPAEFPNILLLTSEPLISAYHENGRNVKFDLTYNLIREKTSLGKQYRVGAFVSLNKNAKIDVHCLVIMADETK